MRSLKIIVSAVVVFCAWASVVLAFFSSKVTMYNKTDRPIFAATYYKRDLPKFEAKQVDKPQVIPVNGKVVFERPSFKFSWDRRVAVAAEQDFLVQNPTHREYVNLAHGEIGVSSGDEFFIKRDAKNKLTVQSVMEKAVAPITGIFKKKKTIITTDDPNAIIVREGTEIAPQEEAFLQKRLPIVRQALEKVVGPLPGQNTPVIALQGSGGGYRAFIGFLGVIQGLQEIGLWDACTYAAGVSGSTWLLSALYGSKKSISDFRDYIQPRFEKDLRRANVYTDSEFRRLFDQKDDFTLVDLWGVMLGNKFFGAGKSLGSEVVLSGLVSCIDKGQLPLYISTAVQRGLTRPSWFEYTPYEVGSADLEAFIPAQYAGAKFINGICQQPKFKEYPLGLHCGVFGSAFAVDMARVAQEINIGFFNLLTAKTRLGGYQITTGSLVNFMRGMDSMVMNRSKNIKVVDAGQDLNIPMPVCVRRKPHIMIIANIFEKAEGDDTKILDRAVADAIKRGYKMPPIAREGMHSRPVTVLQDPNDPTVPVIIYIPNLYAPFATTKFAYKKDQFDQLCDAMKKAVIDNKQLLYDACKNVAAAINGQTSMTPETVAQPVTPGVQVIQKPQQIVTKPATVAVKKVPQAPAPKPLAPPRQAVDPSMTEGNYPIESAGAA